MKKIILGICIAVCASSAIAEVEKSVELLLGTADQKSSDGYSSSSGEDTSFGIRGALAMNRNLAVELAYHNFGETNDGYTDYWGDRINNKVKSNAFSIGARGMLPLTKRFNISARLGLAFWDLEFLHTDSSLPGMEFATDDSGNDVYYGGGAQYHIDPNMILGLEYTIIEAKASIEGIPVEHDIGNLSLSLGFKF